MNQQQQWPAPVRSGSVRRARERMEAGLPPEVPRPVVYEMESPRPAPSLPKQVSSPLRPRAALPIMPAAKSGPSSIGVAISKPTQVPQWPLQGTIENVNDGKQSQPVGRGPPPQRPSRPSRVPSMLDSSRVQGPTPSFQSPSKQQQPRPMRPPQQPQYQQQYSQDRSRMPIRPQQGPVRPQPQYQQQVPADRSRGPMRPNVQPADRGLPRNQSHDAMSPVESPPITPTGSSSRPSTTSSTGSIPDFPLPMPAAARRHPNLGPPPSSRRGASSYYSQTSYVSPIAEVSKSPRTQPSHGSYASSAAIPSSWGDDSPGYRSDDFDDLRRFGDDIIEEGRESRESNLDGDGATLIRSASMGKRAKPSMITTRSTEKVEQRPVPQPQNKPQQQKSKLERMGVLESVAAGAAVGAAGFAAARMGDMEKGGGWPMATDSPLASGTGFINRSTLSTENSVPIMPKALTTDEAIPTPKAAVTGPNTNAMLGAYNAASSLEPGGVAPVRTPSPGYSRLSAIRRPPRLDIDAVRDAEARGSLTSLPDLIRRATRLAYMIDKGKRPGSGMDLNDFPSSPLKRDYVNLSSGDDKKRQSGLSGMLAAFPPPGLATPTRELSNRPNSPWPQAEIDSAASPNSKDEVQKKPKRKCCGLSIGAFLIFLFILLIVIAAAIVVPLKLLVLDKPKKTAAAAVSPLQTCQNNNSTACQNEGISIVTTGTQCSCICINSFTGSTCTSIDANGCTNANLSSTDSQQLLNVTLGESIPRLISQAQTNFSIPLSSTSILSRFNAANLSCSTENALVTFDGQSERKGNAADIVTPTTTGLNSAASSLLAAAKVPREASPDDDDEHEEEYYSTNTYSQTPTNTVLPAPSSAAATPTYTTSTTTTTSIFPSSTSAASSTEASSTTSTSSGSSSSSSSSIFTPTEQALDFARIAVLFILQQEDLNSATDAQSALQKFLQQDSLTTSAASNINVGNGNTIDLVGLSVNVGNGTVGGGGNSGNTMASGSTAKRALGVPILGFRRLLAAI